MDNADEIRTALVKQAKVFKSSWVDLAKSLSLVAEKKLYEAWGYRRLEDYCSRELHIRRQTVEKLVGSYLLLGGQATASDGGIPDLESMHLLAKARKNERIDNETFQRLRETAADRGYSAATLHRKLNEVAPPEPSPDRAAQLRKRIANLVTSLRLLFVEQGGIPGNIDAALREIEGFAKSEQDSA